VSTLADRPTKLTLRAAMEARDLSAALDAFAPDAVLRSPLTGRLTFTGREQIGAILQIVLDTFDDLVYTDELHSGDRAVLVARARVGGTDIEMVDHMRLDQNQEIRELTVFFRPMPAIAVAMRVIGAGLGRRNSRARAGVIALLTRPLGLLTAVGDRIGVWLVRPTV
jgi:ketosteroid isomerase-like protein